MKKEMKQMNRNELMLGVFEKKKKRSIDYIWVSNGKGKGDEFREIVAARSNKEFGFHSAKWKASERFTPKQ